ncbi:hypothetical protein [Staphylococcus equorum]|uniref:hypothetical protein n=1 Tax=Staphylococcus equorum TaxID=246432 RepID=UPI003EBE9F16
MAYEYEEFIDAMRFGLTMSDRDSTDDIWKMVDEVVNKAKAWDNYIVDTYIYDKVYSDGNHKEAYDFYMKPDVKSYIDCLNKELVDTGHSINSVEEYKQILNEIEDK